MYLTREPITLSAVIASPVGAKQSHYEIASLPPSGTPRNDVEADNFKAGASVLFLGKVRDHSEGRKVLYLEYEAFEAMAESVIADLIAEAHHHWSVDEIKILHRLGEVKLGEIAVAIAVKSTHRDEAYQASRFLIEGIKHRVPIWKKEYFEDGTSEWSQCNVPPKGLHLVNGDCCADLQRSA